MRQHSQLTRRLLELDAVPAGRRVSALLSMAADEPSLLQSRYFWWQLRRTGRGLFRGRRAA